MSTAWALANRGIKVTILEQNACAACKACISRALMVSVPNSESKPK
ncbi:hypothetical protein, partial [Psychrobacter sp. I-STPA6b]